MHWTEDTLKAVTPRTGHVRNVQTIIIMNCTGWARACIIQVPGLSDLHSGKHTMAQKLWIIHFFIYIYALVFSPAMFSSDVMTTARYSIQSTCLYINISNHNQHLQSKLSGCCINHELVLHVRGINRSMYTCRDLDSTWQADDADEESLGACITMYVTFAVLICALSTSQTDPRCRKVGFRHIECDFPTCGRSNLETWFADTETNPASLRRTAA